MSSYAEVVVLVEGQTEQRFIREVLAPYMAVQGIYLTPIVLSKQGQKGGDVRFSRAKNDIREHLWQRPDTCITLMVDYYGIKSDWPGYVKSREQTNHTNKAKIINQATAMEVTQLFPNQRPTRRFIPYVSMHEIEALYFSNPDCLASHLGVERKRIDQILREYPNPEAINDDFSTTPSRRLESLSRRFKKISTGIAIAQEVGISRMREVCSLFDTWLTELESLVGCEEDEAPPPPFPPFFGEKP